MRYRRAALISAGAAALSSTHRRGKCGHATSIALSSGFQAWNRPSAVSRLPMAQMVETVSGPAPLAQWIGRRPAVLILWARLVRAVLGRRSAIRRRWRNVCHRGRMDAAVRAASLRQRGRFRFRASDAGPAHAASLPNARLMPGAEQAFQRLFNTTTDRTAQILPSTMLVGGDGLDLAGRLA